MSERPDTRPEILIVDDDPSVRERLERGLADERFEVTTAASVLEAMRRLDRQPGPAAMILDVFLDRQAATDGLPEDGMALLQWVRESLDLPVIMLSAIGAESVKVLALNWGADDYVTKPFSTREITARVNAVLRRRQSLDAEADRLEVGPLTIDFDRHEVSRDGRPVELTHRELRVLEALARAGGKVLTREQILDAAWGPGHHSERRTVDVHVRHLREKIEADPGKPEIILTVRGAGYRCGPSAKAESGESGGDVASAA